MCGIAGQFNYRPAPPPNEKVLLAMREAMQVRGPDGEGLWLDASSGIGLVHRRLAIIDLSERGAQPMASADGRLRVALNGEIYNYPELRKWCESHGSRFASDSDTEVLLHLYDHEGPRFVSRLRGMFAFALWDSRERSLLLARDPFGIKPLYYADNGYVLRFASQVKALLAGGVDAEVDPAGMVSFYLWGYVTEPHTWCRDIRALPAGSTLTLRPRRVPVLRRYCDPLDTLRGKPFACSAVSDLREAVLDSVRHHLLADVTVSLFLSAGIDSGTLCALIAECRNREGLQAVTLGFREYTGTANDEAPAARDIAARYAIKHDVVEYRREDFHAELERLQAVMDQPSVDGVNTYFVSKAAASRGLKVALSGVGGDELFGGYPSFRQVPRLAQSLRHAHVPARMGRALRSVLAPMIGHITSPKYAGVLEYGGSVSGAYLLRKALFMPWEISALVGEDTAREGFGTLDLMASLDALVRDIESPYDQVTALELDVYLKNCLLRDADWAGMAHSLEIRTPLVDVTLFMQLMGLRRKPGGKRFTKADWARTPQSPLPNWILAQPKTGFNVPVHDWVREQNATTWRNRGLRGWGIQIANGLTDVGKRNSPAEAKVRHA